MKNNEVKLYTWTFGVNTNLMQFSIAHPGPGFWKLLIQYETRTSEASSFCVRILDLFYKYLARWTLHRATH